MHVGRVAREQHTTLAVGRRLPRHVGETGDPRRTVRPEVGAVGRDERLTEVLHARFGPLIYLLFPQDDPVRPTTAHAVDRSDATALGTRADLRLRVHLDLGDHPAGRGVRAGEVDARFLA